MNALGEVALTAAARGEPVFPCRAPDNTPAIGAAHPKGDPLRGRCKGECAREGHGFHDATTDLEVIERWWTKYPTANIGVRTGVVFDVLDVDHTDFATGVADLPDCETLGGRVVRSGGGKWHLYFKPTGLGRRIRFSQHCDWLGTDGYVIVPPSVSSEPYEWFSSRDLSLTDAPAELVKFLRGRKVRQPPSPQSNPTLTRRSAWSAAGLIGTVAASTEGERNHTLHWAACRIGEDVARGRVGEHEALESLEQLALAAERAGLGGREVEATIRSGFTTGRAA